MDAKKPEEVFLALSSAIKIEGLTHADAAKKLGMKKQTLSNILSSKKYLSPKQAERFSQAFGFNPEFLTSGMGDILAEPYQPTHADNVRWVRLENRHALSIIKDDQQGDIELMLYWFHEAASRRGDKEGLALWSEVARFSQAKSLVASSMRGFKAPDYDNEYNNRLMRLEEEISNNIEAILDRMTKNQ